MKTPPQGHSVRKPRTPVDGQGRSNLDSPLAKDPNDLRAPNQRLLIHVLMPVDEKPWLCPLDVAIERLEADMNLRVPLMNVPGRIVGDEYINRREIGQ